MRLKPHLPRIALSVSARIISPSASPYRFAPDFMSVSFTPSDSVLPPARVTGERFVVRLFLPS
ncbi:MAG: hypothetical protein ACLUSP_07100 [Christensenellales bacterium]